MSRKTPLYDQHKKQNALIVDFSGWQMPLHYGSQIAEHHAVRKNVGLFDVSHMGVVEITGKEVIPFLRFMFANDVAKLKNHGDALYTCMLNDNGGVIDDLIVYRFDDQHFRLVINAGCRDKDLQHLSEARAKRSGASAYDVEIKLCEDMCLLALQGPKFLDALKNIFDEKVIEQIQQLKPFQFCENPPGAAHRLPFSKGVVIARTGYTGEPGVEIMLPAKEAIALWEKLIAAGAQPCGLGARDTLRLEAGYNLYGADMTETTSPLISNLAWTVSFKDESRDFVGKNALLAEKQKGISQQLIGLLLESKGVLRNHQKVKITAKPIGTTHEVSGLIGEITSGSFSPSLNKSIALARIPMCAATEALVERRGEWMNVKIVKPKFI